MSAAGGVATPAATPARVRIPGVDLARALAILGMFAVHVGPTDVSGTPGRLYALPHGRASLLFALIAGVGVSLLAGSRSASAARTRWRLLWRAVVLLPLGLWLQGLDHRVFVILQDYALLFVVALVLLRLPDRLLLVLAGAAATLGSAGYLYGLLHASEAFERRAAVWGDPLGDIVHRLVLSGPYPLITWLAPFALGMWLGRRDLHRRDLRGWLVLGGGTVTVLAALAATTATTWAGVGEAPVDWRWLWVDDPHSQMPLWVVGSTASACLVLGVCLEAGDAARRLVWPLVAVGQLAFTVYVGHLLALHRWNAVLTADEVGAAAGIVLGLTVASALFAVGWRSLLPRGPLESVLHLPWVVPGRSRPDRSRTDA